jgi:membrane associated rhomboid family serine protease
MSWSQNYEFRVGFGGEGITYYVQLLLMATVGVYVAQLLIDIPFGNLSPNDPPGGWAMLDFLAYSNGRLLNGFVWTPVTYMFLHGGLSHMFWNMFQLWLFGPEVERVLGTRQFFRFYFLCGIVGSLVNLIPMAMGAPSYPVVGASGAVLGVLVAFATIDPDRQLFLFPIPFPVTVRALVILIIFMNLLTAVGGGSNVAVATHFGGMATGYAYMKLRPRMLQWDWNRRGRRVKKKRGDAESPEDEEKLAEAIDNIFKLQDRDRK